MFSRFLYHSSFYYCKGVEPVSLQPLMICTNSQCPGLTNVRILDLDGYYLRIISRT